LIIGMERKKEGILNERLLDNLLSFLNKI
jgi:hypothetical protein